MSFFNSFGYTGERQPTLVFIHGAGMDSTVWSAQARYFAARGRAVLAPDLPGHGRSHGDNLPSIEAMAGWLDTALTERGIDDIILIGHSMGAFIALETASLRPKAPVIVLGAAMAMPVHPALLEAARSDLPAAAAMVAEWGYASGVQRRQQALPSASLAWGSRRLLERSRPGVLAADFAACAAYDKAPLRAREHPASLFAIAGEADRMTPLKSARELMSTRPDALHVLSKVGHMMIIEAPLEVRRLIAKAVA